MFDIFDPCPESPTDADISQRVAVQSQMTLNVVSEIFSKLESSIHSSSLALASVTKRLNSTLKRKCNGNDKQLDEILATLEQRLSNRIAENRASVNIIVGELDRRIAALEGLPPAGYSLPAIQEETGNVQTQQIQRQEKPPTEPTKETTRREPSPQVVEPTKPVDPGTSKPQDPSRETGCGSYQRLSEKIAGIIADEKPPTEFARRLQLMITSLKELAQRDGDAYGDCVADDKLLSDQLLSSLSGVIDDSKGNGSLAGLPEPDIEAYKTLFAMD